MAPTRPMRLMPQATATAAPLTVSKTSQLAQLAQMTVLSIDTGDLGIIKRFADTGLITDATTNPLFISQTAARGTEPEYAALVDEAVAAARKEMGGAAGAPCADAINLAIDHLSVNLGRKILNIVKG
jgi:transaldolase